MSSTFASDRTRAMRSACVSVVDRADLVEDDALTEVVVAEVGEPLEVARIAGEPVVVRGGKEAGTGNLVVDDEAPTDQEGDLLVQDRLGFTDTPERKRPLPFELLREAWEEVDCPQC